MIQTIKITSKNFHLLKNQYYFEDSGIDRSGYINGVPVNLYLNVVYHKGNHREMYSYHTNRLDELELYSTFSTEAPTTLSPPSIKVVNTGIEFTKTDSTLSALGPQPPTSYVLVTSNNFSTLGPGIIIWSSIDGKGMVDDVIYDDDMKAVGVKCWFSTDPNGFAGIRVTIHRSEVDGDGLGLFRYYGNGDITPTPKIDYRFGEDKYVDELKAYIDATYGAHYAGKIGPMDILLAGGQALGFIVGSIIKYAFRLGKKDNYKRDDVLKIAHYAILLLHTYDVLKLGDKKNG